MVNALAAAIVVALTSGTEQNVPRVVTLQDLTVPGDRLPGGCALSPAASVRLDGNSIRGGLWAGLRIRTNPWTGTDASVVASIRERLDGGPPLVPDGPPLTPREQARYRLRFADGIEEAYAAIYLPSNSSGLVVVYGLRFPSADNAVDVWANARRSKNLSTVGLTVGPILAFVSGDGGSCFQSVVAYVKSLEN